MAAHRTHCLILFALLHAALVPPAFAVDGIALTTHRTTGGDWHGFRVDCFGRIDRHDIVNSRVACSRTIYEHDSARCVVIDQAGARVAFVKRGGGIHVMDTGGGDLRALPSANTRHTSWLDWPEGDWVYYSRESLSDLCADAWYDWQGCADAMNIRRINVETGVDEPVTSLGGRVWQLGLEAQARPGDGRLVLSGSPLDSGQIAVRLFDLADPLREVRAFNGCGASISPSGAYVTVNQGTHRDVKIMSWDGHCAAAFHINAWALPEEYDGREQYGYWTAHRWSCNSDKWVFLVQGSNWWGSSNGDAWLYNWQDQRQIRVTWNNPAGGDGADDPEDFWVDKRPRFSVPSGLIDMGRLDTVTVALTNGGESGVLPDASVSARGGGWLDVQCRGTGNAQSITHRIRTALLPDGEYVDTVVVRDPSGTVPPISYAVRAVRGETVVCSVHITTPNPWVTPANITSLSATVFDQYGREMKAPVAWRLESGTGAIDSAGTYTAPAEPGQARVRVWCMPDEGVWDTTTITVGWIPTDGLRLWLRADSLVQRDGAGDVVAWGDLSDGGGDALPDSRMAPAPTWSAAGALDRPCVTFDGADGLWFSPLHLDSFTVFVVYNFPGASDELHIVLGGPLQGLTAGGLRAGYTECGLWKGSGTDLEGSWLMEPSSPPGPAVICAGNASIYRNGVEPPYYIHRAPIPSLDLSAVGCLPESGAYGFRGDLYEVVVYDRALSSAQRESVQRYLHGRYPVQDSVAPLRLLSPNGAETYRVGDTMLVRWRADTQQVPAAVLYLSPDEGETWLPLTPGGAVWQSSESWGRFSFAIPDSIDNGPKPYSPVSRTCRVSVRSYLDHEIYDESDYPFVIAAGQTGFTPRGLRPLRRDPVVRIQRGHIAVLAPPADPIDIRLMSLVGREVLRTRVEPGVSAILTPVSGVYLLFMRGNTSSARPRRVVIASGNRDGVALVH